MIIYILKDTWILHRIILKDTRMVQLLLMLKTLKGNYILYHGDMDDNVHMQNSIYLISRLQDEGKIFEFMLYPDGRHGWGGPKAIHSGMKPIISG